ncbi:hypothetical protein L6R53_07460, partial [Myxococcota bacterium]|nr:hypothetical protein [Myxococcota bacterium]
MRRLALSFLLFATACPAQPPAEPQAPATGGVEGQPPPPTEGAAGGTPPGDAAPPATDAGPGAGPPGAMPPGGAPVVPTLAVTAGEGVVLSGTVTYAGALDRPIRIDLLQKDTAADLPNAMKI